MGIEGIDDLKPGAAADEVTPEAAAEAAKYEVPASDLAPDHDEPGDIDTPEALANLATSPDEIVPDNVDQGVEEPSHE